MEQALRMPPQHLPRGWGRRAGELHFVGRLTRWGHRACNRAGCARRQSGWLGCLSSGVRAVVGFETLGSASRRLRQFQRYRAGVHSDASREERIPPRPVGSVYGSTTLQAGTRRSSPVDAHAQRRRKLCGLRSASRFDPDAAASLSVNVAIFASVPEMEWMSPRHWHAPRSQEHRWTWRRATPSSSRASSALFNCCAALCDPSRCFVARDLGPLYSDDNHLSVHGALSPAALRSPAETGTLLTPCTRTITA